MVNVIIGLILVIAVLLVLVVLVQDSKGGLSGTFGGSGSQVMGAKRTTDLLEQLTWGFVAGIMVLALASNLVLEKPTGQSTFSSPNVEAAQGQTAVTPQSLQGGNPAQAPTTQGQPSTESQTPAPTPVATDSTK